MKTILPMELKLLKVVIYKQSKDSMIVLVTGMEIVRKMT
nr:MAG TPA: hypothetical protein [Caudoviricetes sp.]